jgi:DNA-binding LacI/PurR family transcriptional regulator
MAGRPGVVAVARAAGVSPSTVSNVFNRPHVVSEELRVRVLAAAAELGYGGADPRAKQLRSGQTGAIGVVLRERLAYSFDDVAAVRVLQGVADAADPEQLALVIIPAYPEESGSFAPAIRRAAVDGLILYSLVAEDPLVEAARHRHLPTVVVDSPAPGDVVATDGFDFVGIDEREAAGSAVRHLLELGHRRLGVLSLRLSAEGLQGPAGPEVQARATASVPRGRLEGAASAAAAGGVAWEHVPVEQCQVSDEEHGRAAAHTLLERAPETTALFALSDPIALGAIRAARERGLTVLDDLSVIGFDDSAPPHESLTTIHQPLREKGRAAAERLLLALRGERDSLPPTFLATRLVVRESTAPPA